LKLYIYKYKNKYKIQKIVPNFSKELQKFFFFKVFFVCFCYINFERGLFIYQ